MNSLIPVSRPKIDNLDCDYVLKQSLEKNKIATTDLIEEFEKLVSKKCLRNYGIAVSSGTSALEIAVASLNLKPGSKILIPSFTIVSVLNAVLKNKCKPVFVNVNYNNYNIDFDNLENLINNQNIKACIIVSTYNSSPMMDKISNLLKRNKIKFIEDAAESFGGKFQNKPFGSFGDISILSFYSNKIITTGEGGMILTNNYKFAEFAKKYRNLFFNNRRNFTHDKIGNNNRLTSMQASLGISQLKKINSFLKHRKKLYEIYINELTQEKFQFQEINKNISLPSYWVMPIVLKGKNNSKKIIEELHQKNIQTRHFFYPLNKQPFINKENNSSDLNAWKLFKKGLYLPLGNGITEQEVFYVVKSLKKIFYN